MLNAANIASLINNNLYYQVGPGLQEFRRLPKFGHRSETMLGYQKFSLAQFDYMRRVNQYSPAKIGQYPSVIIHQICLLAREWSKRTTWRNILQLKLRNIGVIFPNLQNRAYCVAKNIWRIINTIAFIWTENMLRYLFLDITSPSKPTVFSSCALRKFKYNLFVLRPNTKRGKRSF